jgi:hypothetical protein
MNNLGKFWQLPYSERWVLVQSLVLLPLNATALRLIGFRRWLAILTALAPTDERFVGPADEANIRQALSIARLVKVAAAHGLYRANCLPQSLAIWWLLRRRGNESELRIGARKEDGRIEAHAWVEYLGLVLNDSADVWQRFTPFDRVIVSREAGTR